MLVLGRVSMVMMVGMVGLVMGGVERVRRDPSLAQGRGGGSSQERGGGGLAEMLAGMLPNTYYSRPRYRYPYYDRTGKEGYCHSNKKCSNSSL